MNRIKVPPRGAHPFSWSNVTKQPGIILLFKYLRHNDVGRQGQVFYLQTEHRVS